MNKDTAKKVLKHAQTIARDAADTCRGEDGQINNQETISSLMLATAIMGRFFNEKPELMHHLLEVMVMAVEEMPPAEDFDEHPVH